VANYASQSDEQLIAAYRAGDSGAFEAIIERYRRELHGFLVRLLGNHASAEDVFQETFLQIHLSAETFDTTRRFKPWLFTIAANKARDYYRKNARQGSFRDLSAPLAGTHSQADNGAFSLGDILESRDFGTDSKMEDSEIRQRVRKTVEAMPYLAREILVMAYFQRMSYNQLADALEIPLGTVKSRLHSAVAQFAELWNQQGGAGEPQEQ